MPEGEYTFVNWPHWDGYTTHRWTDDYGSDLDLNLSESGAAIVTTGDGACRLDLPALRILRDVLDAHIARHTESNQP